MVWDSLLRKFGNVLLWRKFNNYREFKDKGLRNWNDKVETEWVRFALKRELSSRFAISRIQNVNVDSKPFIGSILPTNIPLPGELQVEKCDCFVIVRDRKEKLIILLNAKGYRVYQEEELFEFNVEFSVEDRSCHTYITAVIKNGHPNGEVFFRLHGGQGSHDLYAHLLNEIIWVTDKPIRQTDTNLQRNYGIYGD